MKFQWVYFVFKDFINYEFNKTTQKMVKDMLQKIDSFDGHSKLNKEMLDKFNKVPSSPRIHHPEKYIAYKKKSFSPPITSHLSSYSPKQSNHFFQKLKLVLNGKRTFYFYVFLFFA